MLDVIYTTTLTESVGRLEDSLTLGAVALSETENIALGMALFIDGELMRATIEPVVETAVLGVDRATSGRQTPHAAGAAVYIAWPNYFKNLDPFGPPQELDPNIWVNVRNGGVWLPVGSAWVRQDIVSGAGGADEVTVGVDGNLTMFNSGLVVDAGESIESVVTSVLQAAGDVNSPEDAVVDNIATFADITGESLSDSGVTLATADGLGLIRMARATFDPSATSGSRTIAAHGLGVTLPDGAMVVGGFVHVVTTFQSTAGGTDKATIALKVEGADDLVAAVAIETGTPWDAGRRAIIPKANTPESTSILLTADRELTATVAVAALTAGKAILHIYYIAG